ncbi:hypothetical protein BBO99_00003331 [Phytophthora kernoviae]|uniref:Uncharacterized protein n=1 Tax=Phytophthora kernoviae TaxID=325452 RepID=A0A3R7K0Y7_9STRA|nr:hypothetical protein BBI17_003389 [Phytophthora kernoviae]RLN81879.1 hypothetical protein BBO99_00003331 [Phytophthora kernoviae]
MLNPVTATLMGPTERLAALVVAGGVEQQLSKMKGEHVEASKKVQELQDTLRLSRVRLTNAQQALRDLTEVFHARHRMLPYAQAWVRQAVSLLNTTALLSRVNLNSSTFLPPEYATALTEATRPAPASTANSTSSSVSTSIEKLFPGVNIYARLLRSVSWSQIVASLLQERPSRSEISDAITYATQYELWDDKKTLTPLRSLIGRVEAWVSRAYKCMTKTTNKTQQLSRLKLLMNEYSKLPLTYSQASEPLDVYEQSPEVEVSAFVKQTPEFEAEAGDAAVNNEITGWGQDDTNQEVEIDEEDGADDEWEWQLRVVQRVSEGMTNLSVFASVGFDVVVVLNLQQNAIRDLEPIMGMARTLRVLNAAQNEIAKLPDSDFWAQFRCLTLCFLSQNMLSSWEDIQGLQACSGSLLWLTLANNPLMGFRNARSYVVNKLPFLKALDCFVTTDQEIIKNARPNARFSAQGPRLSITRLYMPLEFETDNAALRYVGETEATVARLFADNSPSIALSFCKSVVPSLG